MNHFSLLFLVFMTMCRYRIACRSQLYLVGTAGDYRIACFHSGEYLYVFTVVGTQGYFLLLVSLFIQLQIDKEQSLLLRQSRARQGDDVLHRGGQEVYFYK